MQAALSTDEMSENDRLQLVRDHIRQVCAAAFDLLLTLTECLPQHCFNPDGTFTMEYYEGAVNMIAKNKIAQAQVSEVRTITLAVFLLCTHTGCIQVVPDLYHMLTGLEMDWDAASRKQTDLYLHGIAELDRQKHAASMDGIKWQMLFDESGRRWGSVCMRGEAAWRPGEIKPSLKLRDVAIGLKLDAEGVNELAGWGVTDAEWRLLLSWLTDNCNTMHGEDGGAVTRRAYMLIIDGIRQTMLPRPRCLSHIHAITYTNARLALLGKAPPFKRGFAKQLHHDCKLLNLTYLGDKCWSKTKLVMIGLGYVKIPILTEKQKKEGVKIQYVHNLLPPSELKPGVTKQVQLCSLQCAREKPKKSKLNRWLYTTMAENSAELHQFIDCMYCLYVATRINYKLPNHPREWLPKAKQSMEARYLGWGYGVDSGGGAVVDHYCRGLASADLGNNLINRMHCLSIGRGRTPFMEVERPPTPWKSSRDGEPSTATRVTETVEVLIEGHTEYDLYTRAVTSLGSTATETLPPGFGMLDISLDAEEWLCELEDFKIDPYLAPGTVFHR